MIDGDLVIWYDQGHASRAAHRFARAIFVLA
jgi:hypothetical protein